MVVVGSGMRGWGGWRLQRPQCQIDSNPAGWWFFATAISLGWSGELGNIPDCSGEMGLAANV